MTADQNLHFEKQTAKKNKQEKGELVHLTTKIHFYMNFTLSLMLYWVHYNQGIFSTTKNT